MAGLQRSNETFRRSGSSGLVWEDRFLSEEVNPEEKKGEGSTEARRASEPQGAPGTVERSRSNGGGRGYRTGRVTPALDPPSPRVGVCGFCGIFANVKHDADKSKPARRC